MKLLVLRYIRRIIFNDRPRYFRDETGRFQSTSDDRILYFPRVKDAPVEFKPLHLRFCRDELVFKQLIDREDEEDGGILLK